MSGCFMSGFKVVMTKKLLTESGIKFHPFDLLASVTPFCIVQLIPVIYILEYPKILENYENIHAYSIACVFATGNEYFYTHVHMHTHTKRNIYTSVDVYIISM